MIQLKKLFVLILIIGLGNTITAQPFQSRKAFEDYLNSHQYSLRKPMTESDLKKIPKKDRPDLAFEQDYLRTLDPATGTPNYTGLAAIAQQINAPSQLTPLVPGSTTATSWVERGPNNVGGRTRALVYDPNDATGKKVWAGGVTGGLWFNSDITSGASQWQNVNDFWDNLVVTCIAYDPNNSMTMYVGTGESYTRAGRGAGIWKSTNGGSTWTQISSTTSFYYLNDIVVRNESGNSVVYAAVDGRYYMGTFHGAADAGLQRSTNGGASWNQVLPNIPSQTINFTPSDIELATDNRIWIGTRRSPYGATDRGGGRVLYSDNGTSWTTSHSVSVTNGYGRVELACAPSDLSVVYALVENDRKLETIVQTTNHGTSWVTKTEPADDDLGIPSTDFTRNQAGYDLIAAVDPNSSSTLIIGGINLHRSTNGGTSWNQISKWSNNPNMNIPNYSEVHADQHQIVFKNGSSSEVLIGNDGGVFYTSAVQNAATSNVFSARNSGYNVTQFYACALSPTAGSNSAFAGAQDNGTQEFSNAGVSGTTEKTGGDGAFCFISQTSPGHKITSYVFNNFYHFDASNNYTSLISDDTSGSFINTADLDDNLGILYTYRDINELYRVTGINSSFPAAPQILTVPFGAEVSALKVSPFTTSSTKLFVGTVAGSLIKVENANTNTTIRTDLTNAFFPTGTISSIEFGATENDIAVTFSNYGVVSVFYSSNGGTSWSSKEGNLPNMPIRWILINPNNSNEAIVATEIGVWGTDDFQATTPTWAISNNGLANVRVNMLQYRSSDNMVIAATYGRGLFESNAFALSGALSLSATTNDPTCLGNNGSINLTVTGGTPPYNYAWSNSDTMQNLSNLNAGSFKVIVTDSLGTKDSLTEVLTAGLAIASFPYNESFENTFGLWYNDTINNQIDWEFDNNGTPSNNTGPSGPASGSFYIRIESSAPNVGLAAPNDEAHLISPCVNLSNALTPYIAFENHQYSGGNTPSLNHSLTLQADSGNGVWFTLFTQIGNQGDQWNQDTVFLSPYIGKALTFKFIAKVASQGQGSQFTGDIGLDNIYISKTAPIFLDSVFAQQPNCNGVTTGSATVNATGGEGSLTYSWSNGTIGQSVTGLAAGIYTVSMSDTVGTIITESITINSVQSITSFPYTESFENSFGLWFNDTITEAIDWEFDNNGSPTGNTGASGPSDGTFYIRIESSAPPLGVGGPGDEAHLIGPCADFSGATNPFIAFENHQRSTSNPTLTLSADSGNGVWFSIFTQSGDLGNQWNQDTVYLNSYIGKTLSFRFTAKTSINTQQSSDIGLDNIYISKAAPIIVDSLIVIQPKCTGVTTGSASLYASGGQGPLTYTWSNGFVGQTATGLAANFYNISITDTIGSLLVEQVQIESKQLITNLPYNESFEKSFGIWSNIKSDQIDWFVDSAASPTNGTGPNGPNEGNYFLRIESSFLPIGDSAILNGPCIDLATASAPLFALQTHQRSQQGFNQGNPNLRIQVDTGDGSWINEMNRTGNQGNQWNLDTIDLSAYIGKTISLRIIATLGTTLPQTTDIGLDGFFIQKDPALYLDSIVTIHPNCSDSIGEIRIYPGGGLMPYTYLWTDGDTNSQKAGLPAGTYSVQISDGYGQVIDSNISIGSITVTNFNYTYDWESGFELWRQSQNDDFDWSLNTGGTNSGGTGPGSANTNNVYIYCETSAADGVFGGDLSTIISPCYNLNGLAAPKFAIENHTYGNPLASLLLEVDTGTGNWQTLALRNASANQDWNLDTLDLFLVKNKTVQFRVTTFVAASGNAYQSDMALDEITVEKGEKLQFTSLIKQVATCAGLNDGSMSVFVKGGYAPYTFVWNSGDSTSSAQNITSGIYAVTVYDAYGDFIDTSASIFDLITISVTSTITDVSCVTASDGSIAVAGSGSNFTPYTFLWNNGDTNATTTSLDTGIYTVTISDQLGCQGTRTDTLFPPNSLNVLTTSTNESCAGLVDGSAAATPSAGTSPYTYLWSTGDTSSTINNLAIGKYYVLVKDANLCQSIDSVLILSGGSLSYTDSIINVGCFGDTTGAIYINSSSSSYSYAWSNGGNTSSISGLDSNRYILTISDTSCTLNDTFYVSHPAPLSFTSLINHVSCGSTNNGNILVTPAGGTSPYSYAWPIGINAIDSFAFNLVADTILIAVTDNNSCFESKNLIVNSSSNVQLTFDSVPDLCQGSNLIILVATPPGGVFKGPNVTGSLFNTTGLSAGIKTLKYVYSDTLGCSDSIIQQVSIDTIPKVFGSAIGPFCNNGDTLTLNHMTPTGGEYFIDGMQQTFLIPINYTPGFKSFKYRVINQCGADSLSSSIAILNAPKIDAGLDQIIFPGDSAIMDGQLVGSPFNIEYIWQPSAGVINPTGFKTATINLFANQTYGLVAEDTTTNCVAVDSVTIFVGVSNVQVTASAQIDTLCPGSSTLLQAIPTGATAIVNYRWTPGNSVSDSTISNPTATVNQFTTYRVIADDGTSSDTAYVPIFIRQEPQMYLPIFGDFCTTYPTFSLNGVGSPLGGTFTVDGAAATTINPSTLSIGNHVVEYSFTNIYGCTGTITRTMNIEQSPTVQFTALADVCEGSSSFNLTGGTPTGGAYSGSGVNNNQYNAGSSGIDTIMYKYSATNGCADSVFQSIVVNAIPLVNAGNDTSISSGQTVNLLGTAIGSNLIYSWTPSAFVSAPTSLSTVSTALTVSTLFELTAINQTTSCTSVDDKLVSLIGGPLSVMVSTATSTICDGDSAMLQALAGGGTGNYSYQWSSSVLNNSQISNPIAAPDSTTSFSVTVSDGVNSAIGSVVINVTQAPSISYGNYGPFCSDDTLSLLPNISPSGGVFSGQGVSLSSFNPSLAGTGQVPIYYDLTYGLTCSLQDSVMVTVNAIPSVFFNLTSGICNNEAPILLSGGAPLGGFYSGPSIANQIFDPSIGAGSYPLIYNYTDTNGCSAQHTRLMQVYDAPIVSAGLDQVIQTGQVTSLAGLFSGGSGNTSSAWSPLVAAVTPTQLNTQTIALTSSTLFTLTVSDASFSCVSTDDILVTVAGGPLQVSAILNVDSICSGDTTSLLAIVSGGSGFYSYSWNNAGSLNNSTILNPLAYPNTTTTYQVTVNDGSTTASTSVTLNINQNPAITFVALPGVCIDQPTVLLNSASPIGGQYFGTGVTSGKFDPITAGIGSHAITYNYTDSNGCYNSSTQNISVFGVPAVSLNLTKDTACEGGNSFLLGGGAPGGGIYSWVNASSQQFNPSSLSSGKYTVSYTITNANNCSGAGVDTMLVQSKPSILLVTSTDVDCNGGTNGAIDIDVQGTGNYSYIWTNGLKTQDLLGLSANSYSVIVTDTNSGCIAVSAIPINEPGIIASIITETNISCFGEDDGILSISNTGGNPPFNYSWTGGLAGNVVDSLTKGLYNVIITDAKNCTSFGSGVITEPLKLIGTVSSSNASCYSSANGNASIAVSGGVKPYTYLWSNNNQTNAIVSLAGGTYYVSVTDSSNCQIVDSAKVIQPVPLTVSAFSVGPTSFCAGVSVVLSINTGTLISYQWKLNGINISGANSPTYVASLTGNYRASVVDANGCTGSSSSIAVNVFAQPTVHLNGVDANFCENEDSILLAGFPLGGVFSGLGIAASYFNPSKLNVGSYNIKYAYTDGNGCSDSVEKEVFIRSKPNITQLLGPTMVQPNQTYSYSISATNGSTYNWTATNGTVTTSSSNYANVLWGTAGIGDLQIVELNSYSCSDTGSFFISIGVQIGVTELGENISIDVYPNPASTSLNVKLANAKGSYEFNLVDGNGRLIQSLGTAKVEFDNQVFTYPLSDLAAGLCFLNVRNKGIDKYIPIIVK